MEATAKEIADLVIELQNRQENVLKEILVHLRPPVSTLPGDNPFGSNYGGGYTRAYGGGGINYERITAEACSDINRTLCTLCTLIENFRVPFGIEGKGGTVLGESAVVTSPSVKTPVETME